MSIVEKVKSLPTPLFVMHFASKAIIALGIGVLLGSCLAGLGWWIVGLGVILSIAPATKIFKK